MSVATKMTAIADKIRNLLGITGAMGLDSMASNLGEVETEVDNQAELIGEILSALDNKVAGSGGGSVEIETCIMTFPQYDYVSDFMTDRACILVTRLDPINNYITTAEYNIYELCLNGGSIDSIVAGSLFYDKHNSLIDTLVYNTGDLTELHVAGGIYQINADVHFRYSDNIPM